MTSKDHLFNTYLKNHPTKAIGAISQLSLADITDLTQHLDHENQLLVFQGLTPSLAAQVLEKFPVAAASGIIEELQFVDAEVILRSMGTSARDQVLSALPASVSEKFKEFLVYSKNQIGSYVNPQIIVFDANITVADAFIRLKSIPAIKQHHLYVVDAQHCLIGYAAISELLSSKPETPVGAIMKRNDLFIRAEMSIKEVLEHWDDRFFELPVTRNNGRLLGIVDRQTLKSRNNVQSGVDTSVKKASNALAELYLIGLTSLMGSSDS